MNRLPSVTAVVLTFNSLVDLPACLAGLLAQEEVDLRICVVDNASSPVNRDALLAIVREKIPDVTLLTAAEAAAVPVSAGGKAFHVQNEVNSGYSAGNNIGARLAAALGSDAVLIVNPDVRISDPQYIGRLAARMMAVPRCAVAASTMRNLAGSNENPMHELGFMEELCWPVWMVLSRAGLRPLSRRKAEREVAKVSGSCLLVRAAFLQESGFFDEGVFLYCEESILGAQVRRLGWTILYVPELEALHAHQAAAKGDPAQRVSEWIRSRRYYHQHYAGYGVLRRSLLRVSQATVLGLTRWQHRISRSD